jgi:predicted metal-dependent enzyme (double-stranded beta helix superfamily)
MQAMTFPGDEVLINALDDAVQCRGACDQTTRVRNALCRLIHDKTLQLPTIVRQAGDESYARRLIHHSRELGYTVLAMTWGPQQGTKIHDHSGMWCVEGVLEGQVEVVQYELVNQDQDRYCFEARGSMQAGVGSAGSLIPPHEYHTIANPLSEQVAITIHVYSGEMTCCNVFEPCRDNWYEKISRSLSYDN